VLDLINFGGSGGGQGRKKNNNSMTTGVTRVSSKRLPQKVSPEAKASRSFFDILNVLSFDPTVFALVFVQEDMQVQKRTLECLLEVIDLIVYNLDQGFYENDEDIEFGWAAKRAQDAMSVFRELGMLP
jgi:hypothetical protein